VKLALVLSPLVAFAGYVLVRALRGRPLSRFALNIGVALFLLVYLLVTAALGVFWVARMDLPAFDWHYLFGYCVVLLAIVHIAFQLRILGSFFRRISPSALLSPNGSAFKPGVRIAAAIAGALVLLSPFAWLALVAVKGGAPARVSLGARSSEPTSAQTTADSAELGPRDAIWIEREDGRVSALDYLHEQSSYSRSGLLRSVGVAPARPPDVKEYAGAKHAPLPKPPVRANVSFDDVLRGARPGGHRVVTSDNGGKASLLELSALAYYAAGVTSAAAESGGILLRAAASSGALYPVDLYAITDEANGSGPKAYYYDPRRHTLFAVNAPVEHLGAGLARPEGIGDAAATFALAVTFDRTVQKYNVRSYRYVALDPGHVAANLVLAGTALGFTCRLLSLFDDTAVTSALALEPDVEAALLVVPCARRLTGSRGPRRLGRRPIAGDERRVVLHQPGRHRDREALAISCCPRLRRRSSGEARVRPLRLDDVRRPLAPARREGSATAAPALGVDLREETLAPGHVLRRQSDRPGYRDHPPRSDHPRL
jgi:SagB-type dehydrogenase family enzyme